MKIIDDVNGDDCQNSNKQTTIPNRRFNENSLIELSPSASSSSLSTNKSQCQSTNKQIISSDNQQNNDTHNHHHHHHHHYPEHKQLRIIFAGGVSAAVTRVFVQPLDVLKIRFQLQVEPFSSSVHKSKYISMIQAIRLITKEEGLIAFWKGHNPAQALSIIYGIAQFWCYERCKDQAKALHLHYDHTHLSNFICGGIAGGFGTIITTPLDVIRTRLIAQDNNRGYRNTWVAFFTIAKHEGIRGLYRGLLPSLLQITPLTGINFMVYHLFNNTTKDLLRLHSKSEIPPYISLFNGAMAGCISKIAVYPLDLAKKRLQIQGFSEHRQNFGVHFSCNGIINCILLTVQREGLWGLYKGMTPSLYKSALTSALNFCIYDNIVKIIV